MDRVVQKRKPSALKIDLKSTNGLYMETVNPCNDFLVDFLIASKLKSQKQGIGKFTTYNLAIESVRKYPLPIICEAQLAALEGFGDFFINEAAKRIQKHYKRGRLPTQQEIFQDDQEHFAALQNNRRKGYKKRKQIYNNLNNQEDEDEDEEEEAEQAEGEEHKQTQNQKQQIQSNSQTKKASSLPEKPQQKPKRSKRVESYKPRSQTQPWKILKALYILNAKNKSVAKGQVNEIFFIWCKNTVKSWQFCRNKLREAGYIEFDEDEKDLIKLSEKGYAFIVEQLGSDAQKEKQLISNKLEEDSNKMFKVDSKGRLKLIEVDPNQQLKILVNQQLSSNCNQKNVVPQMLGQIGEHKFEYRDLKVGTFMWQIYGKVLDYIVLRYIDVSQKFNRDNLAINCNLARVGQWSHITLIIESEKQKDEDYMSDNLGQKMEQMRMTLLDCRAADFKIVVVENLEQTLNYVSEITNILKQKIDNIKQNGGINVLSSLEVANKKVVQSKMQAKLYSRCMRLLPGMNKAAADKMTVKFGTFKMTQHKLKTKFEDIQQRKKFLKQLFSECEIGDENIDKILTFFYADVYP